MCTYADEQKGRIVEQLRAAFPYPAFNADYDPDGFFWVLRVKDRTTKTYDVEYLASPHAESDVVDSIKAKLGIVDDQWPDVSARLDELIESAELPDEVEDGSMWEPDGFTACRNCGFKLAQSSWHPQTMYRSESCARCGFRCSVTLENALGAATGGSHEVDSLQILETNEAVTCPVCDSAMLICVEEKTCGRSLVAYCHTCECYAESTYIAD